jgi:hypothetical protein
VDQFFSHEDLLHSVGRNSKALYSNRSSHSFSIQKFYEPDSKSLYLDGAHYTRTGFLLRARYEEEGQKTTRDHNVGPLHVMNVEGCQPVGGLVREGIEHAIGNDATDHGGRPDPQRHCEDRQQSEVPIVGWAADVSNVVFDPAGVRMRSKPLVPNGLRTA